MAKQPKPPGHPPATWASFYAAHPTPYVGIFAARKSIPGGLSNAVKGTVGPMVQGPMATWSLTPGKALLVGFADPADFIRVRSHFSGKPWTPIIKGALDGFQVVI